MQPLYSLTDGLTNNQISKAVDFALHNTEMPEEFLPARIRREYDLVKRKAALMEIHFPKSKETMRDARNRLVFDEFFIFTLVLNQLKENKKNEYNEYYISCKEECEEMIEKLPYELTNAQKKVWNEIKNDMTSNKVMNRLVQGDVGSGKTILAVLALMMAALNGYQGTLMVPTEV